MPASPFALLTEAHDMPDRRARRATSLAARGPPPPRISRSHAAATWRSVGRRPATAARASAAVNATGPLYHATRGAPCSGDPTMRYARPPARAHRLLFTGSRK